MNKTIVEIEYKKVKHDERYELCLPKTSSVLRTERGEYWKCKRVCFAFVTEGNPKTLQEK